MRWDIVKWRRGRRGGGNGSAMEHGKLEGVESGIASVRGGRAVRRLRRFPHLAKKLTASCLVNKWTKRRTKDS